MNHETKDYLDYIQKGYDNLQSCVRLLDTKATIINTANSILIAYIVSFGSWWITSHDCSTNWPLICILGYLLTILALATSMFFAFKVFYQTAKVWFPNHSPRTKEKFSALFPEWDNDKLTEPFIRNYFKNLKTDPKRLLHDQEEQCIAMGGIINTKIDNLQKAKKSIVYLGFCLMVSSLSPVIGKLYVIFFL